MARVAAILLLAGLAGAETQVFDAETDLWPNGVEYSLEKPAAEVHLVLAFRHGLCTLGERGSTALASAQFVVEYNDADRQTCYWNKYRPLPFDEEENPGWSGAEDAPGLFITEADESGLVDRVLVVRLPRVNRWRIRVTPLYGDTEVVRRGATLVQVAEVRDAKPRVFEELDPLPVEEEVEVPAEAEEAETPAAEETPAAVDDQREEPVAWTEVVSVGNTTVRTIRAGSVPRATGYQAANRAARRRAAGVNGPQRGNPADPTWQPLPALQPMPAPLPFPRPVGGAPVAGKVPPWGAPLPFWAVPKPRPQRAPPRAPRVPVPPTGASR